MPPKTTVNWTSVDTWQRLVAAIAATGVKIDLHEVAKMYGTTYDTIQNRYRKIRTEAEQLKKDVKGSVEGDEAVAKPKKSGKTSATATPTPRKGKGTKDALSTVTNGRVTKDTPKKTKSVKKETKEAGGHAVDDIFAGVDFGADSGDVGMVDEDEFTF